MRNKHTFTTLLMLAALLLSGGKATAQTFFNLTADEVKVDSMLPMFTHSMPLHGEWADSVYTVSIEYAEFIDMSKTDIDKCRKLREGGFPSLPKPVSNVVVERKRGHLEVAFCPIVVRDGKWQKLVSFMLDVKSSPVRRSLLKARAASSVSAADRYAAHSILATGQWAKIRVPATGIYQLTDALVRQAGFSDPSKVRVYGYGGALQDEKLSGSYLAEYDDLKEVPTCVVDGKRLFHAVGTVTWSGNTATRRTRNPYSDYGYYFLTEAEGEPLTVDSTAFVDSFYPSADDYHVLHEVDNYAWYQGGRNLFENSPVSAGRSKDYTVGVASGQPGAGTVAVGVTAGQNTTVSVAVNDSVVGTYSMSFGEYDHGREVEYAYKIPNLGTSNKVTVTTVSGGPARLDYIATVQSVPRPRPILRNTVFAAPDYVYNITNQDHHADGPVDMVIIVPTSGTLRQQAERIKTLHEQRDTMTVRIVPADELYNEFSSGTPDANAYRRYLKMLYDRAETEADMPSYLLLFGDCVWDNRMNTPECQGLNADDFLLCHESENSFSATDCYVDDGFFCLLDDGEGDDPKLNKLDMAVGRFPVRNADEAKVMVDKTISYVENKNAGSWQNVMMFMGDDGNSNRHMEDADMMATLAETINPAIQAKRVMWDAYPRVSSSTGNTYPAASNVIKQQQNSGALIMNYSGHGSAYQISHERVLSLADFSSFTNKNLPLWITASCDIMPFDSQTANIGETALLNSNGGAVAFYGTTRTVWIDRNRAINYAYLKFLLTPQSDGRYVTLGEAQRLAKNFLIEASDEEAKPAGKDQTINKLQYSLLGDPALRLNLPKNKVVIDSINGVALASANNVPAMQAGSVVSVKGHVEAVGGGVDASFKGTVSALVRDSEKEIVCRLNDTSSEGASTPFRYTDRDKVLYSGSNNVTEGKFGFSFAVPMDIDYSDKTGLINVLAVNSETAEAVNGYSDDFTVGGTGSLGTDSIGPSVYCYLNSPSFSNGGSVNATPYFVAEISDKDGINATGSGIGHDLVLTIDGDASKTYVLNDNFSYDFGSYTKGSTYYNIPELAPGKHTLRFKAWDIMNNSSVTELSFNVAKNLAPGYLSVGLTDNPATTGTTFIIAHDRAGSNLSVEVEVFDMSGRPLWKHKETGVASLEPYTLTWNLNCDNGGRLGTGVYICRVNVGCDGSGTTSKVTKLVVTDR